MQTSTHAAADTTASIHKWIAWIYGVFGTVASLCVGFLFDSGGMGFVVFAVIGAIVGLHAALSAGAARHNEFARIGSLLVGVLMLFGFPIGTVIGGFLIYNGAQDWTSRRDPSAAPAGRDLRSL